jgi:uncharacterized protein YjbI with pentapeptide repeats
MENNILDPLYASVFDDPQNGTPNDITQAGCLALAQLGKDAWNAWYKVYPVSVENNGTVRKNIVDFSDLDFGAYFDRPGKKIVLAIDFSGFRFREYANFSNAKFSNRAKFDGAIFDGPVDFSGAEFKERAYFGGVKFGSTANFSGVNFQRKARFGGAQFGDWSNFKGARFSGDTNFGGAQFGIGADFRDAEFSSSVAFTGAQFGVFTRFDGSCFRGRAIFSATDWAFIATVYEELDAAKKWAELRGISPEVFKDISFRGVHFGGRVDFSGRMFSGPTSFARLSNDFVRNQPVVFAKAPLFHNCKLTQDISFDGAEFRPELPSSVDDDTAARAYRTLKLAFAQQQALREEQMFFRLELAEEEKRAPPTQRSLFLLYRWTSDYGFSLKRPLHLLLFACPIFMLIYAGLAGLTPCLSLQAGCEINYKLIQFLLLQSLPLPGLDKWSDGLRESLFTIPGWRSVVLPLFVMLHKGISLLAVFLFGLALRNLFKMK